MLARWPEYFSLQPTGPQGALVQSTGARGQLDAQAAQVKLGVDVISGRHLGGMLEVNL